MTSTNKPKRIALCLILLFTALGVTLTNATTENDYKIDNNLLPRIYESTHTENGRKANIIINPYTTGIYAKESDFNLDFTIISQGIGGVLTENNYQLDLIPEKIFPDIPDLAVTSVIRSKTCVGEGYAMFIEATVKNIGFYFENFNFIAYANDTIIHPQMAKCPKCGYMTLVGGGSATITFLWNATGFAYGNYTISAVANTVGEIDTADNTYVDSWVIVTVVGDICGDPNKPDPDPRWNPADGDVDRYDYGVFAQVYGLSIGDPDYMPEADFVGDPLDPNPNIPDHDVDRYDYGIFAQNYGATVP